MIIIINCGLWDLLDVKSEAGLLLAIIQASNLREKTAWSRG